jgi:hypothetical protein
MDVLIVGGRIGGLPRARRRGRSRRRDQGLRGQASARDQSGRPTIDDVVSREELVVLSVSYKRVAGCAKERLKARG